MGAVEAEALVSGEASLGYHPEDFGILTRSRNPAGRHGQAGSLTGAVAS